jgi:hypothetical protein
MTGAGFQCGDFLDCCTCRYTGPIALSPAGMRLRHEASMKRARRRSAGQPRPSMREAMEAANVAQRGSERPQRPPQRSRPVSLSEPVVSVIRKVGRAA